MQHFVFSVRDDHCNDKSNYKQNSENQLSFRKHNLIFIQKYIFIAVFYYFRKVKNKNYAKTIKRS